MAATRFLSLWGPVAAWAALIFVLSSISGLAVTHGIWDTILRKSAHLVEYGVLGGLLARALDRPLPSLVLGSLYAVTDEVHQSLVAGRHGSPLDWLIDTVGVAAGVILVARATR